MSDPDAWKGSYDAWKTASPDDDRCEFCGVLLKYNRGWQPDACTDECGRGWRDPDAEYDQMIAERDARPGDADYFPVEQDDYE